MRVAVLADIHGNLPALEAVLQEVDEAGADAIVLNGDIAAGPLPVETLDVLAALGERAVWVRGNCDRLMVEAYDGTYRPLGSTRPDTLFPWTGGQLFRAQRDRLADLPLSVTLDVDGLGPVRFCHATTRGDEEIVLVDSPISRFQEVCAGVAEPVVVCGHTHMPFDRLADGRRVVNPGSVGMPFGGAGAHWGLLGPDVRLRRTPYDLDAAAERLMRSTWSESAAFVADLRNPPGDAAMLARLSAVI